MISNKVLSTAGKSIKLASTDLWSGNSSSQTIVNDIDLADNGGLVIISNRTFTNDCNLTNLWWNKPYLSIGIQNQAISWWRTKNEVYYAGQGFTIGAFNSDGYEINIDDPSVNESGQNYAGHCFKKERDFYYDTYGNSDGSSEVVFDLSLGLSTLGAVVIFQTNQTSNHAYFWHRSNSANNSFNISTTSTNANAETTTSSKFTVSGTTVTALAGQWPFGTIFIYAFAHNANEIICDEYTGNGSSTGPTVTLGWKPQLLIVKRKDGTGNWRLYDNVRDTTNPISTSTILNTRSADDTSGEDVDFNETGFQIKSSAADVNASGSTYVYMAVRKQ